MNRSIRNKFGTALVAVVILVACVGCDAFTLTGVAVSNAASWTAGFFTGTLTTISQIGTRCYANGTEIDCSELPSGL